MNQKNIIAIVGVVVILLGAIIYFAIINRVSQPVMPALKGIQQTGATQQPASAVQSTPSNNQATVSKKTYSTLNEYNASIDYSCNSDSDCTIKDIGNCCGTNPSCVNSDAKVDSDFVNKACAKENLVSICGFASIDSCKCVNKKCQGYLKE